MKIDRWLEVHKLSGAWLADQIGLDRSTVNKFRRGEAMPSLRVAARIEKVTGGEVTAIDYMPRDKNNRIITTGDMEDIIEPSMEDIVESSMEE